jgi:hypothetical protein
MHCLCVERRNKGIGHKYISLNELPKVLNHPIGENSPNLVTLPPNYRLTSFLEAEL